MSEPRYYLEIRGSDGSWSDDGHGYGPCESDDIDDVIYDAKWLLSLSDFSDGELRIIDRTTDTVEIEHVDSEEDA